MIIDTEFSHIKELLLVFGIHYYTAEVTNSSSIRENKKKKKNIFAE
jgi:hypothetical protein